MDAAGLQWVPVTAEGYVNVFFKKALFSSCFTQAYDQRSAPDVVTCMLKCTQQFFVSVYIWACFFFTLDHWPKSCTHFLGVWFTTSRPLYWQQLGRMTHMWAPWLPDMALLYHLPNWAKRSQRSLEALVCYVQPHVWYVNYVHLCFLFACIRWVRHLGWLWFILFIRWLEGKCWSYWPCVQARGNAAIIGYHGASCTCLFFDEAPERHKHLQYHGSKHMDALSIQPYFAQTAISI